MRKSAAVPVRLRRGNGDTCVLEMRADGKGFTVTESVGGKKRVEKEEYRSTVSAEAALKMRVDDMILDQGWVRGAGKEPKAPVKAPPDLRAWYAELPASWKRALAASRKAGMKLDARLADLARVKELSLCEAGLDDLGPLKELVTLQELDLYGNQFEDLAPLARLVHLRSLSIANCAEVTDLRPLTKLRGLTVLDISSTSATDLRPIAKIGTLERLAVAGLHGIADFESQVLRLRKALPRCRISTVE